MATMAETMAALQTAHPNNQFTIRHGSTWTSASTPGISYEVTWTGEASTQAVQLTLNQTGWPTG